MLKSGVRFQLASDKRPQAGSLRQLRYARPPQHKIPKTEGVRTQQWKYTRYTDFTPPYEQLFDLAADPQERKNLAGDAAHTATLAKLRARCDEYREQLR